MTKLDKSDLVYVAGHTGLVGSALCRELKNRGLDNLLLRTHDELDLIDQNSVKRFFQEFRPDFVFLAAARVGGISANWNYPAEFIYENLMIESNVIHQSHLSGVKKLLFLGSSCIYPKFAKQPITEDDLLIGKLEPTNEPYALAKIAGISLCDSYRRQYGSDFISVMPTNLYGPNDSFDLETSHVLPALMRKFHEAKDKGLNTVTVWGSGNPKREFLYIDDLADALVFLMQNYSSSGPINVGFGSDISIRDLARKIADVVGFQGRIEYDHSRPDGTPRKLLDSGKISRLGWRPRVSLEEGIERTYQWFLKHHNYI